MGQEEKALHDLTMVSLLEASSQSIPERVQQLLSQLETSVGSRLARVELARRARDGDFVTFYRFSHFQKLPPPTKAACISRLAFYTSERSDAYNPDHLSIEELTRRIEHYPEEGEKKTKGDLLLMRGGQLKSEKRYNEAFEDFKQAADATNACSDLAAATLEKATFLNLCGDVSGARPLFESLYTEGDRSVNLLVKYASCLLELEDEKHKAVFDEAVTCNPTASDGYFHRGQMYFLENNVEKSMAVGSRCATHR